MEIPFEIKTQLGDLDVTLVGVFEEDGTTYLDDVLYEEQSFLDTLSYIYSLGKCSNGYGTALEQMEYFASEYADELIAEYKQDMKEYYD